MSLYANINVSKASSETPAPKGPPVKTSKSAALYAGVLAKPPAPSQPFSSIKETVLPEDTPQAVEVETTKAAEASGRYRRDLVILMSQHCNSNLLSDEFRKS